MDPTLIVALTGLFVASGSGVGFFIKRADTRRKANEDALIDHLKAELARERDRSARLEEALDIRTQDGLSWQAQLLANGITPKPEHPTPLPKEDR